MEQPFQKEPKCREENSYPQSKTTTKLFTESSMGFPSSVRIWMDRLERYVGLSYFKSQCLANLNACQYLQFKAVNKM